MKISIKEAYHWDMESFLRLHELMDEITIDDNSILSLLKAILDNDPIRIINGGITVFYQTYKPENINITYEETRAKCVDKKKNSMEQYIKELSPDELENLFDVLYEEKKRRDNDKN